MYSGSGAIWQIVSYAVQVELNKRVIITNKREHIMATPTVIGTKSTGDGKALAYIASWSDLTNTFGYNAAAGETHWVNSGAHETALGYGRGNIIFDAAAYLAAWSDLRDAFGASGAAAEALATQHWIECGSKEIIYGRTFLSDTITLTTGMDTQSGATVTAGAGDHGYAGMAYNDTFNAVEIISPLSGSAVKTWSAGDKIDGGLGSDTFNVIQTADITAPAGATVKNIETANLTSGGSITVNTIGWTGLTDLNIEGAGASSITAAATTSVNELSSVAASSITGGRNINVVHSTVGGVTIADAAGTVNVTSSFAGGAVTVTQVNKATGAETIAAKGNITAGGTSLTASILDAVSFANQQAHQVTATADAAVVATATATDLANAALVAADGVLAAAVAGSSSVATTNAATLVAYNAGALTHAQKTSIDTAFATSLTTSVNAARSAALAVETPIFTATTNAKTSSAAVLATDTATAATSLAVVVADAAAPAYTVTDTANSALATASVTGNYTGSVTITDNSVTGTVLKSVTLDNAGTAVLTGNGLTTITVSNNVNAVTITNATAAHTLDLTLSDTISPISDAVATTLNIHSNGTTNAPVITAGLVTVASIDGAGALTDNLTGLAATAVITATTSTGHNQVTIGAGQSYLGGLGIDDVTTGAALQTAAVNAGSGVADRLIVTNAANFAITGAAKFTGFDVLRSVGTTVADVALFTKSAFTSIETSGNSSISGLNGTQAANIQVIDSNTNPTFGVIGASNVGQLDTVHITANDNLVTVSTIALGTPVIAGVETLHFTAVDNLNVTALTGAPALTAVTIDGAGIVNIGTGALTLNPNTVIDAHSATGATTISALGALVNGISITGSATGNNTLTGNAFASILAGGNGNDNITGGVGADIITVGHGNNIIVGGGGADTITVGNGFNSITTGAGIDTITVGTGGNIITSGAGADVITFGTHVLGTNDILVFGVNNTAAANMDTITGFVSGADSIQLQISKGTDATSTYGVKDAAAVVADQTHVATVGTLSAVVTDSTSVANSAAVYVELATALNNAVGHEFAASTALAGGIVAREVTFTTGAAAGTYLVINDGNVGFQAATDVVVHLVGTTTVAASDFTYSVVA